MDKRAIKKILLDILTLEIEWEEIADPQWTWYGNMSFHNPNDYELYRLVAIQDEKRELRKQLRQKIGIFQYIKYIISPLKFIKNY